MASILLIDDDTGLRDYLRAELTARGHAVESLDCAEHGFDRLSEDRFDVVVLDNKMPRITGLEFLEQIRSDEVDVPVVLMTASPTSATAIRATRLGAFKYVIKPGDKRALADALDSEINAVLERARESARLPSARFTPADEVPGGPVLVGNSKPMLEVFHRIGLFADGRHTVLIRGETGTGKELVARAIHDESPRKDKPFVPVNCGAIASNLAESQLFGHKKGSFTGADRDHAGFFERAAAGTLFLDEIGDMPLDLQVKLLRVLQEGRFERVGGTEPVKADVRVLAATHCDLLGMVRDGTFREDLYYRLDRFVISLPPLRERLEDLPDLVDCILAREATAGRARPAVAEATLEQLRAYHWPGNVRDLENVVTRAFTLCLRDGYQLLPRHIEFPAATGSRPAARAEPPAESEPLAGLRRAAAWAFNTGRPRVWDMLHERLQRELLAVALEQCEGNKTAAADRLGISWNTLNKLLKEHKLND